MAGVLGMLILTRRVGETIRIGEDIGVTVLGVKGNQVRVGVEAPRSVEVHREEVYERLAVESQQVIPVQAKAVDGWLSGEAHVGSVPVVPMQPGR